MSVSTAPQSPSPVEKRRGRKRPNIALTLPGEIFQAFRTIGLSDRMLSAALGIPRSTITIVCAGIAPDLSVSREEFSKLKAFAAQKAAEIRVVVAALELY